MCAALPKGCWSPPAVHPLPLTAPTHPQQPTLCAPEMNQALSRTPRLSSTLITSTMAAACRAAPQGQRRCSDGGQAPRHAPLAQAAQGAVARCAQAHDQAPRCPAHSVGPAAAHHDVDDVRRRLAAYLDDLQRQREQQWCRGWQELAWGGPWWKAWPCNSDAEGNIPSCAVSHQAM